MAEVNRHPLFAFYVGNVGKYNKTKNLIFNGAQQLYADKMSKDVRGDQHSENENVSEEHIQNLAHSVISRIDQKEVDSINYFGDKRKCENRQRCSENSFCQWS